ncbi:MAG TPA: hypothetical protein VM008_12430 [Phycisphaerae bacterium]|nr:hypothetical protein [Phycisphaerae bacterium]
MKTFVGVGAMFRNAWKVTAVFGLIMFWAATFMAGSLVDSQWLRDSALTEKSVFRSILDFAAYFATWGWTNIIILTVTASVGGDIAADHKFGEENRPSRFLCVLARGFFIFLMLVTGQILANGTIEGADAIVRQAQYFRFATFGSLCSFIVGYSPGLMTGLVERLSKLFAPETTAASAPAMGGGSQTPANNGKSAERDACVNPVGMGELQLKRD